MLIAAALGMPYWERYGSFAVLGLAGVLPWLLYRRAPQLLLLSTVLVLVFTGTTVGQIVGDWGRYTPSRDRWHRRCDRAWSCPRSTLVCQSWLRIR